MLSSNKPQTAKILLVEDEPDMVRLVSNWLTRQQHTVDVITNGDEALAHLKNNQNKYEIVILDIMLPGRSGIEICQQYRNQSGTAPILMLTARDAIEDKEIAFKVGVDDYLTKPFHLKELSARISALLRRGPITPSDMLTLGDIDIYFSEHRITKNGAPVHLSPKEFQLFEFLAKHPHHVFSPEVLLEQVWGAQSDAMHDTIRGHINRLRRKLDTSGKPSLIASIYGFGYRFDPPANA